MRSLGFVALARVREHFSGEDSARMQLHALRYACAKGGARGGEALAVCLARAQPGLAADPAFAAALAHEDSKASLETAALADEGTGDAAWAGVLAALRGSAPAPAVPGSLRRRLKCAPRTPGVEVRKLVLPES